MDEKNKKLTFLLRVWGFCLPTALTEINEQQLWHEPRHFVLLSCWQVKVWAVVKSEHSAVLQVLEHSKFDLSLCSWPSCLCAVVEIARHLPWLKGWRRWPQWITCWVKHSIPCRTPLNMRLLFNIAFACTAWIYFTLHRGCAIYSYVASLSAWPVACRDLPSGNAVVSPHKDAAAEWWSLLTY